MINDNDYGYIFHQFRLKNEQKNIISLYFYDMCDLIRDVITCCVCSCDADKINACDKNNVLKPKKEQHRNERTFYINLHIKDRLDIEFTAR